VRRLATLMLLSLTASGCMTPVGDRVAPVDGRGPRTEAMSADQLGQTDFNRTVSIALRDNLADRRMVNRATDVPFGRVSFSGGIAAVFDYPDPRAALKAADEALYVAKEEGRNRIVRAPARLTLVGATKAA